MSSAFSCPENPEAPRGHDYRPTSVVVGGGVLIYAVCRWCLVLVRVE